MPLSPGVDVSAILDMVVSQTIFEALRQVVERFRSLPFGLNVKTDTGGKRFMELECEHQNGLFVRGAGRYYIASRHRVLLFHEELMNTRTQWRG